jgi:hypothetical protein
MHPSPSLTARDDLQGRRVASRQVGAAPKQKPQQWITAAV